MLPTTRTYRYMWILLYVQTYNIRSSYCIHDGEKLKNKKKTKTKKKTCPGDSASGTGVTAN